jgi:hypothetical protein
MPTRTRRVAFATLFLAASCASSGGGQRSSGNVINSEQIAATRAQNAYEIVEQLQPTWLVSRGPQSLTDPGAPHPTASVYLDGMRAGDLEYLRTIAANNIAEIRYYTASEASARFGMGHPRGVIAVTSKGTGG